MWGDTKRSTGVSDRQAGHRDKIVCHSLKEGCVTYKRIKVSCNNLVIIHLNANLSFSLTF